MTGSIWLEENARMLSVLADRTRWNLMEIFAEAKAPESLKSLQDKLKLRGIVVTKENLSKHLKQMVVIGLIQQKKYESYNPVSPERYEEIFKLVQEISRICDVGRKMHETSFLYPRIEIEKRKNTKEKMVRQFADSLRTLMKPENFNWITADEKRELFLKAVKIGVDFTKVL